MTAFDPNVACDEAGDVLDEQLGALTIRAVADVDRARELAREYADHLAAGGDPAKHPKIGWGTAGTAGGETISPANALRAVYRAWDRCRERGNPVCPINNGATWRIAEHLLEHLGEPVALEELRRVGRHGYGTASAPDVARRIKALEQDSDGAYVVKRATLGGKVAYRAIRAAVTPTADASVTGVSTLTDDERGAA